jgi:hypothetical protein
VLELGPSNARWDWDTGRADSPDQADIKETQRSSGDAHRLSSDAVLDRLAGGNIVGHVGADLVG